MKKIIVASIVVSVSLLASGAFNSERVNENLAAFNKEQNLSMKVLGESPIGNNFHFVVVGDLKANKFMNIVVGDDADIAIAPAQIVPLSPTKEWDSQKAKLDEMLNSMKKISREPASRELTKLTKSLGDDNVFYFNGADKANEYEVFVVDPKCPHCQDEMATVINALSNSNKPFAVMPLAAFGEDSVDSVVYLLKNSKKSDFKTFATAFKEAQEKSESDPVVKEKVLKESMMVFSSGLVNGVPFSFDYSGSYLK